MLTKQELEETKKQIKTFFDKTGFKVEISVSLEQETLKIDLKSEEPQVLIGEQGKVLISIQKLLKAILNKSLEKIFYVDVDINDYKKKKIQYLKETAKKIGDEVALSRKEKALPPMPAYERRVIHLELADRKDITTQSIGKEPDRRLVIKPYP